MDKAIANQSNVTLADLSDERILWEYRSQRPDTVVGESSSDSRPAPMVNKARCGFIPLVGSSIAHLASKVIGRWLLEDVT